jgi:hypothetical protein
MTSPDSTSRLAGLSTAHRLTDESRSAKPWPTCRHCHYYPVSPRIPGYCSWDCYECDYDQPASRATRGAVPLTPSIDSHPETERLRS